MTTLQARAVTVRFGGLTAVNDVTLGLRQGEVLGLIGPNGAGKTTLVNVLSGFQRPMAGTIAVGDTDCTRLARHGFAGAGIVRTFQAVRLFKGLTVSENVEVGYVAAGLGRFAARRRAREILAELGLADKSDRLAAGLSYGEERRVGLARALAVHPRYLLLDEPAAGLAPAEVDQLRDVVGAVRAKYGCGVLVIEHNMAFVMTLCERIHVLDGGRTIASGTPSEIRANAEVRRAYLGSTAAQ
ncbi:MAG TPA: ABC transporter ATP-binding protein [Bauldia sp.]|nr:ABC transporter ATP-binding protein [Bauldia sp.]